MNYIKFIVERNLVFGKDKRTDFKNDMDFIDYIEGKIYTVGNVIQLTS